MVFFFLPNKHTHKHLPDIIEMPSPLRQVAWECGECATTNRGTEQLPSSCSYCRAENPRRYEILAGSAPAATARTVQVMRTEQHDIVRAASEARVAVVPRPVVDHALLAERLRGTLIDIVGTESSENGRIRLGAQRNHTKNYLCAKPENTRKLEYSLSQTMLFFIAYAAYPTVFSFFAATMVWSGFGPYHGMWREYDQTKCIGAILTPWAMTIALGLGVITLQPELYHAYGGVCLRNFILCRKIDDRFHVHQQ